MTQSHLSEEERQINCFSERAMYGSGDWLQPKHPTAGFLPPRDFLDCCCVSRSFPDQEDENRDRWTQCQVRAQALLLVCRALLSQFSLAALLVPFLAFLMHQCMPVKYFSQIFLYFSFQTLNYIFSDNCTDMPERVLATTVIIIATFFMPPSIGKPAVSSQ